MCERESKRIVENGIIREYENEQKILRVCVAPPQAARQLSSMNVA